MIQIDLQPAEAQYIRNVLGQCPHDHVNGLIVRIEQAMRPAVEPEASAPAAGLPISGDETH